MPDTHPGLAPVGFFAASGTLPARPGLRPVRHGEPDSVTITVTAAAQPGDATRHQRRTGNTHRHSPSQVPGQHRRAGLPAIKRITRPMLGFKGFRCARILLGGIELMHMIAKGQMQRPGGAAASAAQQFYSLAA
ncbi:Integrase catalytic region (fragment) [Cupriavidus necator]|uniref:Integrase catalytic region n=1 Tax=Cupriavidus necator TaxID=106590 RepID=A0A1K0IH52_CUPNE